MPLVALGPCRFFMVVEGCRGVRGEIHHGGPSSPPDPDVREQHCLTAGWYVISLWNGNSEQGDATLAREIPVDYVQRHTNLTAYNTHAASDEHDGGP